MHTYAPGYTKVDKKAENLNSNSEFLRFLLH